MFDQALLQRWLPDTLHLDLTIAGVHSGQAFDRWSWRHNTRRAKRDTEQDTLMKMVVMMLKQAIGYEFYEAVLNCLVR